MTVTTSALELKVRTDGGEESLGQDLELAGGSTVREWRSGGSENSAYQGKRYERVKNV